MVKEGRLADFENVYYTEEHLHRQDNEGKTTLHWAAIRGHAAIVVRLIQEGAAINTQDNEGWTSLHWAAFNGRAGIASILIASGADCSLLNQDKRTPAQLAQDSHKYEIAEMIEKSVQTRKKVREAENDHPPKDSTDTRSDAKAAQNTKITKIGEAPSVFFKEVDKNGGNSSPIALNTNSQLTKVHN